MFKIAQGERVKTLTSRMNFEKDHDDHTPNKVDGVQVITRMISE